MGEISILSCPITGEEMRDPVITRCGHTFERAAITKWHAKSINCPICRTKIISLADLVRNHALADIMPSHRMPCDVDVHPHVSANLCQDDTIYVPISQNGITNVCSSDRMKPISDALCRFMNLKPGSRSCRVDVTRFICEYVKHNNLQNPANNKEIMPDDALRTLFPNLAAGETMTFISMQLLLAHNSCFISK